MKSPEDINCHKSPLPLSRWPHLLPSDEAGFAHSIVSYEDDLEDVIVSDISAFS